MNDRKTTRLDILRHGAVEGGIRYRGSQDDPLSSLGRKQMDAVWQYLHSSIDVILCSPLQRCRLAAQDWGKQQGIPCLIEPRLQELHYGDWEGMSKDAIRRTYPGMLERWRSNPEGMRIPGAKETIEDFYQGKQALLHSIATDYQGKHILAVTHSGSSRALLAAALQAPIASMRHFAMPYAAWHRMYFDKEGWQLQGLNQSIAEKPNKPED